MGVVVFILLAVLVMVGVMLLLVLSSKRHKRKQLERMQLDILAMWVIGAGYSGTPLIQTPMGQKNVLVRCPFFRGCMQELFLGKEKVSLLERCP